MTGKLNWGWVAAVAILLLLACWLGIYKPRMGGFGAMER